MNLFFQKLGEGPPVVILHGLFGMSDNWMSIARKLSSDYSIYLPDLRNHGRSPHSPNMDYALMAQDVYNFVQHIGLKNFSLVGHSMGGKTAIQYAVKYEKTISKLVIVDITPKRHIASQFIDFIDAMFALDLLVIANRSDAESELIQNLKVNSATCQFLLKNLYRDEQNHFNWRINLIALKNNIAHILDEVKIEKPIHIKTAFIKGELSNYISLDSINLLRKQFSMVEFYEIPRATHWVHSAAPKDFESALRTFLK